MRRGINKKGLAILEHFLWLAVIIFTLGAMQIYITRAIKGNMKADTDSISWQYSPEYENYAYTEFKSSETKETVAVSGESKEELMKSDVTYKAYGTDESFSVPVSGSGAERLLEQE